MVVTVSFMCHLDGDMECLPKCIWLSVILGVSVRVCGGETDI